MLTFTRFNKVYADIYKVWFGGNIGKVLPPHCKVWFGGNVEKILGWHYYLPGLVWWEYWRSFILTFTRYGLVGIQARFYADIYKVWFYGNRGKVYADTCKVWYGGSIGKVLYCHIQGLVWQENTVGKVLSQHLQGLVWWEYRQSFIPTFPRFGLVEK